MNVKLGHTLMDIHPLVTEGCLSRRISVSHMDCAFTVRCPWSLRRGACIQYVQEVSIRAIAKGRAGPKGCGMRYQQRPMYRYICIYFEISPGIKYEDVYDCNLIALRAKQ